MVAFNGNNGYLALDAVDVSGKVTECNIKRATSTEVVTAGFGQTDEQRAGKLNDRTGNIVIAYEEGRVPSYIRSIQTGKRVNLVYGPEGAVSGKPKHQQDVIFTSVDGPKQSVDKTKIVFSADWEQADKPMVDMYDGGVFA